MNVATWLSRLHFACLRGEAEAMKSLSHIYTA